jgi:hypothetical protein
MLPLPRINVRDLDKFAPFIKTSLIFNVCKKASRLWKSYSGIVVKTVPAVQAVACVTPGNPAVELAAYAPVVLQ